MQAICIEKRTFYDIFSLLVQYNTTWKIFSDHTYLLETRNRFMRCNHCIFIDFFFHLEFRHSGIRLMISKFENPRVTIFSMIRDFGRIHYSGYTVPQMVNKLLFQGALKICFVLTNMRINSA